MTDRAIRYVRHHVLSGFGTTGQRALDDAHALVIGLGGLGCPVVQYLTGSGVGLLTINDFDRVDESNLARQLLYQPDDLGRPKVAAVTDWIEQNNGDVSVEAIARRLDPTELEDHVSQADVIIDCTDNITARTTIADVCRSMETPLVFGAAAAWQGQYAVFRFDQESPKCFSTVLNERDEWLEDCQGRGVFAPVLGVIGAAMAGEAIKLLIGAGDSGDLLRLFDHRQGWREIKLGS